MLSENRLPASPKELAAGNARVTVEGDSMQPTAANGVTVIFAKTEMANDNDVVVVRLGEELLVKRITYKHDEILLKSDNPKCPTMHCTHDEIAVIGKAVKICSMLYLLFF